MRLRSSPSNKAWYVSCILSTKVRMY